MLSEAILLLPYRELCIPWAVSSVQDVQAFPKEEGRCTSPPCFTNTLSHLSAAHTKYTSLPTPLPCHKRTISHGPPLAAVHIVLMEEDFLPGGRNEQSCPAEMLHSACMRPSAVHHHHNWPKRSITALMTKQKSPSTFTSSLNLLLPCSEVVPECFTFPWK